MSNQPDSHDVRQQVRKHVRIFLALIVFTFVTVGASYLQIQSTSATIAIALVVAFVEAFLVAGHMMHIISERRVVHIVLVFTVIFFAALMYLILWATRPDNRIHMH